MWFSTSMGDRGNEHIYVGMYHVDFSFWLLTYSSSFVYNINITYVNIPTLRSFETFEQICKSRMILKKLNKF